MGVEAERLAAERIISQTESDLLDRICQTPPPPVRIALDAWTNLHPPTLPELPRVVGEGRMIVGALTRALKELAPDSCVQINEDAWFGRGRLEVSVVGVGAWEADSAIDILGMCRAKLRLPGRSYDELKADLERCGR
jgi:hypothetical protein